MSSKNKKEKQDKNSEDYILEKSQSRHFDTTFILIICVVIITAIAVVGVLFDYW